MRQRLRCSSVVALVFGGLVTARVAAQTPPSNQALPKIGSTLSADILSHLPAGANLFSILETTQPDVVTDRFNSSGLNAGEPARVTGLLGSWSQTRYRIGDVNITSPNGGLPLLFPEIAFWQQVHVTSGYMPAALSAPGLVVSLEPRRPSSEWRGTIEGSGAGSGFSATAVSGNAPPIGRLQSWANGSVVLSGPVIAKRLGVMIGGTWTRNSTVERVYPAHLRQEVRSGFVHAVLTPVPGTQVRTLGWVQRAEVPSATGFSSLRATMPTRDLSVHVQSTLERSAADRLAWRIFGGYTRRGRARVNGDADAMSSEDGSSSVNFVVDRLVDGPIPALVSDRDSVERRWALGARVSPPLRNKRHTVQLGADAEWIGARGSAPLAGSIGEMVDGVPARVWVYPSPGFESKRHATTLSMFAEDRIALSPRLMLEASLRVESVDGSANGGSTGISWRTLLASAHVRRELGTPYHLALVTGYGRSANQLQLGVLAVGDPAAPVASVFRWDPSPAGGRTLVARVGPGTGGDPAFSRIDPQLKRPYTDSFVIGLEARPRPALRLGVTGIARREDDLVNVVNIGVPVASYVTFTVPDANVDLVKPSDDQDLIVYNRLAESFGRDQYLLTNPGQEPATMGAVVVTAQVSTVRLSLLVGATASAAVGAGGNRGFRAIENDQNVLGELFTNPNASTYARGRLFSDRAYTIKWTTVYRFPRDIHLGAIARYQDGQPFARLVVVPGLNQGAEAIQAFANGRSRFAFTGTLDIRLQKGFAVGATRLDAILDAYNLLNMRKEVEEYVVTGDRFRTPTAVQPPRAFHVGLRVRF